MYALENGHLDVVELLKNYADTIAKYNDGKSIYL